MLAVRIKFAGDMHPRPPVADTLGSILHLVGDVTNADADACAPRIRPSAPKQPPPVPVRITASMLACHDRPREIGVRFSDRKHACACLQLRLWPSAFWRMDDGDWSEEGGWKGRVEVGCGCLMEVADLQSIVIAPCS